LPSAGETFQKQLLKYVSRRRCEMLHELKASLAQYFSFGDTEQQGTQTRRQEARFTQSGRTLSIVIGDVRSPFAVNNISATGISGRVEVLPDVGIELHVEFEDGCAASGTVKWVRGSLIGIGFDAPLPDDVIDWEAPDGSQSPRPPRFEVSQPARLHAGTQSAHAVIVNVSRGGMRLETSMAAIPGQRVRVEMDGFPPLYGRVRWAKLNALGVMFEEPISLKEFDEATRKH
jgi:hypothetical protein